MICSSPSSIRATCVLVLLLAITEEVRAARNHGSAWDISGSIAALTDYVDRGVSQSDGHGAVQADILWQHAKGAYVALWGSTVDFNDGRQATAEINYILGIKREIAAAQVDGSVAFIQYPGAASELDYDLIELSAQIEHPVGPIDLIGQAIYAPRNAGDSGKAVYVALTASKQLSQTLAVSAHVGRQWHELKWIAGPDRNDWGVALGWSRERLHLRFRADLKFSDADASRACADICDARVTAGVGVSF